MNVGPVFEIAYGECGGPFIGRPLPTVNAALWGRRDADLASSDVVPSLTTCPIFHHHPGLSSVRSEEKCSLTHTSKRQRRTKYRGTTDEIRMPPTQKG